VIKLALPTQPQQPTTQTIDSQPTPSRQWPRRSTDWPGFEPRLDMAKAATLTSGFFMPVSQPGFVVLVYYGVVTWAALQLAAPYRGSSNPLNHVSQRFEPMGGGLFPDMEYPQ